MALNNRKELEAPRLHGVNLLDDPIDVEFGTFTTLSNWISIELYSLSKKRGVGLVPAGAQMVVVVCETNDPGSVFCGLDQVLACGEAIMCEVGVNLITSNSDPIVGLAGSQIACS